MSEPKSTPGDFAYAQQLIDDLRKAYLGELPAQFDELDLLTVALRKDADYQHHFEALFRKVHSIKGTAGVYGLSIISTVCHRLEDHLRLVNGDYARMAAGDVDTWLAHVDLMRQAHAQLLAGQESFRDIEDALDEIRADIFSKNYSGLIVEASRSTVMACRTALESCPVQFTVMDDGYRALERLLTDKVDLLICGMELHTLNGAALIAATKLARGTSRNVKTVLLTSNPDIKSVMDIKPDVVLQRGAQLMSQLQSRVKKLLHLEHIQA
jgi:chemotaxis protein histidine kinase CheA